MTIEEKIKYVSEVIGTNIVETILTTPDIEYTTNQLIWMIPGGAGMDREPIIEMLNEVITYIREHFVNNIPQEVEQTFSIPTPIKLEVDEISEFGPSNVPVSINEELEILEPEQVPDVITEPVLVKVAEIEIDDEPKVEKPKRNRKSKVEPFSEGEVQ